MSHLSLSRYGYILKKDQLTKDQVNMIKKDLIVKPLVLPIFEAMGISESRTPYPIYIESNKGYFCQGFMVLKNSDNHKLPALRLV